MAERAPGEPARTIRDKIPREQCVILGANIRALRLHRGRSQARLGELMGWPSNSTVCAAEGHRSERQRGFNSGEVEQPAAASGACPSKLMMRCTKCGGHPPAGFACLACGATPDDNQFAGSALPYPAQHSHAAATG